MPNSDTASLNVYVSAGATIPEPSPGLCSHCAEYVNSGEASYEPVTPIACLDRICISPRMNRSRNDGVVSRIAIISGCAAPKPE